MTIETTEETASGKTVTRIRIGKDDGNIILGLLSAGIMHTPRTEAATKTVQRMIAMHRDLTKWKAEHYG